MSGMEKRTRCSKAASDRTRALILRLEPRAVIPRVYSVDYVAGDPRLRGGELVVVSERYDMDLVQYRALFGLDLAAFERVFLGPLLRGAAEAGVVHLDLRPENVVVRLDPDGAVARARLVDVEPAVHRDTLYEFVYVDPARPGEYQGRATTRRTHLMMRTWAALLYMRGGWSVLGDGSWLDDPLLDIAPNQLGRRELELLTELVIRQAVQLSCPIGPGIVADVLSQQNRSARVPLLQWAHRTRDLDAVRSVLQSVPVTERVDPCRPDVTMVRTNGRWRLAMSDDLA